MQPYFIPHLGYYSLIKYTDKWIVFDPVQYIRHGWINRNRVLKPNKGWQYIGVPLKKHQQDTLIKDIKISDNNDWKDRIMRQLEHYRKRSPYYPEVENFLRDCFKFQTNSISHLNAHLLEKTCNYLNIEFDYEIYSEADIDIPRVKHAGEWALEISKKMQASEYVNPLSGEEIFNKEKFEKENIKLSFLQNNFKPYDQNGKIFELGLSIIDAMMFNSAEELNILIDDYKIK